MADYAVHHALNKKTIGTTRQMRADLKDSYLPAAPITQEALQKVLGTTASAKVVGTLRIVEFPSGRGGEKKDTEMTPRGKMRKPNDGGFYSS